MISAFSQYDINENRTAHHNTLEKYSYITLHETRKNSEA